MTAIASLGDTIKSLCSVLRCFATFLDCSTSLNWFSWKPMLNVFTGFIDWDCIKATTRDESIPPDKKAPNGTSDIIC